MLIPETAALLVIDIQEKLFPPNETVRREFVTNATKLIRCAQVLEMPVFVAEQNPERLGATYAPVAEALGGTARHAKLEFSAMANPGFNAAVRASERRSLLVIGMETHVCVMQTALDALNEGYTVHTVRDAVLSMRKKQYKAGLERIAQAGGVLATTQMTLFELLRRAGTPAFKAMLPLLKEDAGNA